MIVSIVGNKSSKSCRAIINNTGIRRYVGQKTDIIINYGLNSDKLALLFRKYPVAAEIPMLNSHIGQSKYQSVKSVEQNGILIPETRLTLPKTCNLSDWIEKRVHSSQGNGIITARGYGRIAGKYYQRMVKNREYELRVHAFSWILKKDWAIHKRMGPPDQIAWNFHQGGHFQRIHSLNNHKIFTDARNISEKVIEIMGMSFGAVDLIVDDNMKIFFIEINSSPGFSALSEGIYFDAMAKLKFLSMLEIKQLIDAEKFALRSGK